MTVTNTNVPAINLNQRLRSIVSLPENQISGPLCGLCRFLLFPPSVQRVKDRHRHTRQQGRGDLARTLVTEILENF
jgi:hypothetical protein